VSYPTLIVPVVLTMMQMVIVSNRLPQVQYHSSPRILPSPTISCLYKHVQSTHKSSTSMEDAYRVEDFNPTARDASDIRHHHYHQRISGFYQHSQHPVSNVMMGTTLSTILEQAKEYALPAPSQGARSARRVNSRARCVTRDSPSTSTLLLRSTSVFLARYQHLYQQVSACLMTASGSVQLIHKIA
jgi:hypothetical protein